MQLASPKRHHTLLFGPTDERWKAVRKSVATAFSVANMRALYPKIRDACAKVGAALSAGRKCPASARECLCAAADAARSGCELLCGDCACIMRKWTPVLQRPTNSHKFSPVEHLLHPTWRVPQVLLMSSNMQFCRWPYVWSLQCCSKPSNANAYEQTQTACRVWLRSSLPTSLLRRARTR
jgi:hypothetical protein